MTTRVRLAAASWSTLTAVVFALTWFAVLAVAMYVGLNQPTLLLAWFIAYPMFALYPGVAAFAAWRSRSPRLVIAVAVLVPMAVLGWTLLTNAVTGSGIFVRDHRVMYFLVTLFAGLGLMYAIRMGVRVMRDGHVVIGTVGAGATFILATAIAFFPALMFEF